MRSASGRSKPPNLKRSTRGGLRMMHIAKIGPVDGRRAHKRLRLGSDLGQLPRADEIERGLEAEAIVSSHGLKS